MNCKVSKIAPIVSMAFTGNVGAVKLPTAPMKSALTQDLIMIGQCA